MQRIAPILILLILLAAPAHAASLWSQSGGFLLPCRQGFTNAGQQWPRWDRAVKPAYRKVGHGGPVWLRSSRRMPRSSIELRFSTSS